MHLKQTLFNNVLTPAIFILLLAPTLWLIAGIQLNTLGANPIEYIFHSLGIWSLRIFLLTLMLSPIRRALNWIQLVQLRRMMGLFTFYYVCLHFLCYLWFEQDFSLTAAFTDTIDRPFVAIGLLAFILLIPMAITSTHHKRRKLGPHWKRLHMLVYPAVIFGVLHFWWLVKADTTEPLIYAMIATFLFIERLWQVKKKYVSGV